MDANPGRSLGALFFFWREGMGCFSEVWKFVYSRHGRQVLPSTVRQEFWSALVLVPLFRVNLRVPVDPMVTCLTGGAICRPHGSWPGSFQAGPNASNDFVRR